MLFRFLKFNWPTLTQKGGFTILEMLVVIAIIVIMTGVLLNNLPSFRDSTTLQLVAQEVATTIRSSQVFGIGTRVSQSTSFLGHGMYFCAPTNPACKKTFVLFTDNNNNKYFDQADSFKSGGNWKDSCGVGASDPNNECGELYNLVGNIEVCSISTNLEAEASVLSVTFSRLYPDAFIYTTLPEANAGAVQADYADIYLRSIKENKQRKIRIYNTGAITVEGVDAADNHCPIT